MSNVGQRERMTQQRIVELFQTDLGYRYLEKNINGLTKTVSF